MNPQNTILFVKQRKNEQQLLRQNYFRPRHLQLLSWQVPKSERFLSGFRALPKTHLRWLAKGLAQWLRSLPPNPEVPSSIPGLVEGWIFGWPSFPLKFTQLSILTGSVKWVPAYMDWFEVAATCAYICFRSAGGKLIIVKHLWACHMEKALYKCTTLWLPPVLHLPEPLNFTKGFLVHHDRLVSFLARLSYNNF